MKLRAQGLAQSIASPVSQLGIRPLGPDSLVFSRSSASSRCVALDKLIQLSVTHELESDRNRTYLPGQPGQLKDCRHAQDMEQCSATVHAFQ